MSTKIALVEDNASVRKRLEQNLRYFPNADIVLLAEDGDDFLTKMAAQDISKYPQVVLMDMTLPGQQCTLTIHAFKIKYPAIEVIVLANFEDKTNIEKAMDAGAIGYLLKDESPVRLATAIEEVKQYINTGARINYNYLKDLSENTNTVQYSPYKNSYSLSERELVVVSYLVKGKTYSEIAEIIFLSPHTVKTHIKNIYKKMNVHTRAEVVKLALEAELAVL